MKKALIGSLIVLLGCGVALAQRAANAYKATKLSTTSVLVSCQDEREPDVIHISETKTAIIITCKVK